MPEKPSEAVREFRIEDYPLLRMGQIIAATQELIVSGVSSYRLTASSWRAIAFLAEHDDLTVKALAEGAIVERSALSRIVDQLERNGYVNRIANPDDGRSSRLRLSKKGRALFEECRPHALAAMATAFRGIDDADMAHLFNTLDRISANLK